MVCIWLIMTALLCPLTLFIFPVFIPWQWQKKKMQQAKSNLATKGHKPTGEPVLTFLRGGGGQIFYRWYFKTIQSHCCAVIRQTYLVLGLINSEISLFFRSESVSYLVFQSSVRTKLFSGRGSHWKLRSRAVGVFGSDAAAGLQFWGGQISDCEATSALWFNSLTGFYRNHHQISLCNH